MTPHILQLMGQKVWAPLLKSRDILKSICANFGAFICRITSWPFLRLNPPTNSTVRSVSYADYIGEKPDIAAKGPLQAYCLMYLELTRVIPSHPISMSAPWTVQSWQAYPVNSTCVRMTTSPDHNARCTDCLIASMLVTHGIINLQITNKMFNLEIMHRSMH